MSCPRQKNYFLIIIQSTVETDIWLVTKSNLIGSVTGKISGLYSTVEMMSVFVSPSEKTAENKSLRLLLKLELKLYNLRRTLF